MRWKNSLLEIYKIVRVFVNTLTADDKHYLPNRDNLTQPIQMQFSQKIKTFSEVFFAFLKSILHFKHSAKKVGFDSCRISGNTGPEKHG